MKMTLFSGVRVDPWNIQSGDLDVQTIAHSQSLLCRFGGHATEFYSVAQHCVRVAQLVPKHLRLEGLLHDSTEAVVQDLIRPVKSRIREYRDLEHSIWAVLARRFRLPPDFSAEVYQADNAVLKAEIRQFLNPPGRDEELALEFWSQFQDVEPVTRAWTPREAEAMYLMTFSDALAQYAAYFEDRELEGELDAL